MLLKTFLTRKILVLLSLVLLLTAFSGSVPANEDQKYLAFAEVMPEPVGGIGAIVKKITYPEIARKSNVQGKVYILAFIDESGKVTDVKVIRGIGAGCDEAAVKAVKSSDFTPGKNKGTPVKVKLSLPITFKL